MSMTLKMDMRKFSASMRELKRRRGFSDTKLVRFWTRRLVQKACFHTPISAIFVESPLFIKKLEDRIIYAKLRTMGRTLAVNRGRARAGWWAAARMVGLSTVYAPSAPDRGEGSAIDHSTRVGNASMTITNSVPYITRIQGHGNFFGRAVQETTAQMQSQLAQEYRRVLAI